MSPVNPQNLGSRPSSVHGDHVKVLLCTFNGERFLAEQLDSIAAQTHKNWSIAVSDDGSTDKTLDILHAYQDVWGRDRLQIFHGPREGFSKNFMSILACLEALPDYCSWADQDDIWHPQKLEIAIEWLKTIFDGLPALYCGRTENITKEGSAYGVSPLFKRPPSFANSLVQSIAGGNTMVFNQAAIKVLQVGCNEISIPSHDWWAYMLICGVGGVVHYDTEPYVRYRQHENNVVGSNSGLFARINRVRLMLSGRFRRWNQQHITALDSMSKILSIENQETLNCFKKARAGGVFSRLLFYKRSGVYRQTRLGALALLFAVLCDAL